MKCTSFANERSEGGIKVQIYQFTKFQTTQTCKFTSNNFLPVWFNSLDNCHQACVLALTTKPLCAINLILL